jgi:hypothetical protein
LIILLQIFSEHEEKISRAFESTNRTIRGGEALNINFLPPGLRLKTSVLFLQFDADLYPNINFLAFSSGLEEKKAGRRRRGEGEYRFD